VRAAAVHPIRPLAMRMVTLYGKPGCCLCERAHALLERLRGGHQFGIEPFEIEQIDITGDDALHKRFLVRIPVIALDGMELYDYEVDESDLVARLGGRPPPMGRS
jgi:glutaredoxin